MFYKIQKSFSKAIQLSIILSLFSNFLGTNTAIAMSKQDSYRENGTTNNYLESNDTEIVSSITADGTYHTCALLSTGGVKCWGQNLSGELGDGTTIQRETPVDVLGLSSGVTAIVAGGWHTCALLNTGGVKCWGYNGNGQLGDGSTTDRYTPVGVSGLSSGVIAIVAGGWHTCALLNTGGVKCWGYNGNGQLGDGSTTDRYTPVEVSGLSSSVVAITAGGQHTCALLSTGEVKCWGDNLLGQIGDSTNTDRFTPVNVSSLSSGVNAIAGGGHHTCALMNSGAIKCWGDNGLGQLGDGTTTHRNVPVDVLGLSNGTIAIAAGSSYDNAHTCALLSTGGVKCWGRNDAGQVGDGTTTYRLVPVDVSNLGNSVTAIDAGGYHTCALLETGGVRCWGENHQGQLGDGTTVNRSVPTDVNGLTGIKDLINYGSVIQDFYGLEDSAQDVLIQLDGKIVVVGCAEVATNNHSVALVRYLPDGNLDTTFGIDGKQITQLSTGKDCALATTQDANGKILVVGYAAVNERDWALARYNMNGELDTSFGTNGKVITNFGGYDTATAVGVDSQGRIVVAGVTDTTGNYHIAVARFTSSGTLDTSFDGDGIATPMIGSSSYYDFAYDLVIQPDDKIIVAGDKETSLGYNLALVRLNTNGSLDTTFDNDGKVTTAITSYVDVINAVNLQSDGKIIVAGRDGYDNYLLARYNANGSLDTSFGGGDGFEQTDFCGSFCDNEALDIQALSNGKILTIGWSEIISGSKDVVVAVYENNGVLSSEFSIDGWEFTDFDTNEDIGNAVAIESDGDFIVAGSTGTGDLQDMAIIAYQGFPNAVPQWQSGSGTSELEVFQTGENSIRAYWQIAIDPEGSVVTYTLITGSIQHPITCHAPTREEYDCYDDLYGFSKGDLFTPSIIAADTGGSTSHDQTNTDQLEILEFKTISQLATYSEAQLDNLIGQGDFVLEAVPVTVKISFLTHPITQALLLIGSLHKLSLSAIFKTVGENAAEKLIHQFIVDTGSTVQILQAVNVLDDPVYFATTLEESLNPLVIEQFPVGHPGFITGHLEKTWACSISSGCENVYRVRSKLDSWHENWEQWHFPASGTYDQNTIGALFGSNPYSLGALPECIAENASSTSPSGSLGPISLIGVAKDRWIENGYAYLELWKIEGDVCEINVGGVADTLHYERVIAKLNVPLSQLIPNPNAVVELHGPMSYIYDSLSKTTIITIDTTSGGSKYVHVGSETQIGTDEEKPDWKTQIYMAGLESPGDLHVYDSSGNHVGPVYDGSGNTIRFDNEIPGAFYVGPETEPEILIILGTSAEDLTTYVTGTGSGTFDLTLEFSDKFGRNFHDLSFGSVPVNPNTKARVVNAGGASYVLELDGDGNDSYESTILPDDHNILENTAPTTLSAYNGSTLITSDQPIVAIGRPHIGSEIMAYNGVDSGAQTVYLPMLFNNKWGYTSSFTVQNTGSLSAIYTIAFKDAANGSTSCVISGETLAPYQAITYDITNLGNCDSGVLPADWFGGATITSNQPLAAVAKPNINGSDAITYNGFTEGNATAYLPMLFRGKWGYQSAFYVQNLDGAQNANIAIDLYDVDGNYTCSYADSSPIGPNVTRGYWLAAINDTSQCIGGTGFPTDGWAGSAVINTGSGSSELVAIGRPHLGVEVAAYNGFSSGGQTNYLPMLFRGKWGYNAAFYVQNISTSNTTIAISFYDVDGNFTCAYNDPKSLSPKATRGYWLPALNCNSGGSFPLTGWAGSAKVVTDQNVIAVGRPHLSDQQVVVYNAFTGGTNKVFTPMLFRKYGSNESALYIQNLGTSVANTTISYFDEESGYYCQMTKLVQPGSAGAIWLAALDNTVCSP